MNNIIFVLFLFSCFKIAAQKKTERIFDYLVKGYDYAIISIEFMGDYCVTKENVSSFIFKKS